MANSDPVNDFREFSVSTLGLRWNSMNKSFEAILGWGNDRDVIASTNE